MKKPSASGVIFALEADKDKRRFPVLQQPAHSAERRTEPTFLISNTMSGRFLPFALSI